jgi:hypothetical protein
MGPLPGGQAVYFPGKDWEIFRSGRESNEQNHVQADTTNIAGYAIARL